MQGLRPDPPVENQKRAGIFPRSAILAAVLHELLNVESFATIADLADALKTRAARLHIPYDVQAITDALVIVHRTRDLTR